MEKLNNIIQQLDVSKVDEDRKPILNALTAYISSSIEKGKTPNLNFICTHNSRRSQFSQIWAKVMADHYGVKLHSFSGGTEATAFNDRAVASLERYGFEVEQEGSVNPHYFIKYSNNDPSLEMYSKVYDAPENPSKEFAAVMTCSEADENCPVVIGCDRRIPLRYEDPKAFDDTPLEAKMYDERSTQIAREMKYVFSKVSEK